MQQNTGENQRKLADLLRNLTTEQIKWITVRSQCTSDADAARRLGINRNTPGTWPPAVRDALRLMAEDGILVAREILRRNLPKAADVKAGGLDSRHERIRQDVATEILDRHMGKPRQAVDVSGSVEFEWLDQSSSPTSTS